MRCKHCQQELEKGVTLCPECGTDNAEIAQETTEEQKPAQEVAQTPETECRVSETSPKGIAKIAIAFAVLVALLVLLVTTILRDKDHSADTTESTPPTETSETTESTEAVEMTVPADTGLDDATCKGTYTINDAELISNLDNVVATMGDVEMTVADLQIYYWLQVRSFLSDYYYYVIYGYVNFDYTQPLDTQVCDFDETRTWQQYFIDCAISAWQEFNAMALAAEKNNVEMLADCQEDLDNMEQSLQEAAEENGFATVNELLEYNMGAGATYDAYAKYMYVYYMGYSYYMQLYEGCTPTDEEVADYYAENAESYETSYDVTAEDRVVDVRHILIMPQGGTTDEETGTTTYSDEEWNDCRTRAEEILNEWLSGEKTEDSFGELANTYSEDTGSNTAGGLYEDVTEGYMVEAFNDWCFDESRMPGDYGMVQTPYGWHIMYFVDSGYAWFGYAQEDLLYERLDAQMAEAISAYELSVDYSAMLLGYVDMAG